MASLNLECKASDNEYRNNYVIVYDNETLQYETFAHNHLLKNEPCIIKNVVHNKNDDDQQWHIFDEWLNHKDDNNNVMNYDYLIKQYGDSKVDVAYCGNKSYSDQERKSMKLSNYLKYIQENRKANDNLNAWLHHIKQYKLSRFDPKWTADILYCKDWHIVNDLKTDCNLYETPTVFSDDWLNFYWDKKGTSDYKFCYLGPLFSWTPLHFDVYGSYSWSTNVIGHKLWILFSPKESEYYLKNKKRNEWIYSLLSLVDNEDAINEYKSSEYPHLKQLFDDSNDILCKRIIIQKENEAIFIPSMWFHEVYNLSDVVFSVNHNWFNGFNIHWIWRCVYNEYQRVLQSIEDLKDILDENAFYDKSQELLMDFLGIHFDEFLAIISLNSDYIGKILLHHDNQQNINNFKIKTYLFAMKNVTITIQKCLQSNCMNEKHTKQIKEIQTKIEQTLSKLQHLRLDDIIWKVVP